MISPSPRGGSKKFLDFFATAIKYLKLWVTSSLIAFVTQDFARWVRQTFSTFDRGSKSLISFKYWVSAVFCLYEAGIDGDNDFILIQDFLMLQNHYPYPFFHRLNFLLILPQKRRYPEYYIPLLFD